MARIRVSNTPSPSRVKTSSPQVNDSPSRQLIIDLEKALAQFQIHELELRKLHEYDCRSFQENLNSIDTRKAEDDGAALEAATVKHNNVRLEAEAELKQHYHQIEEQERVKREQERQRQKDQKIQQDLEKRRKAEEEARKAVRKKKEKEAAAKEAAEREAEHKRRVAATREEFERLEKEKKQRQKEQEIADAAKRDAKDKADREKESQAATEVKQATQSDIGPSGSSPSSSTNAQHQKYLDIHQRLKCFRKEFWTRCKKDAALKGKIGEMRRGIKTSVGQLTDTKSANKQPVSIVLPQDRPFTHFTKSRTRRRESELF